MRFIAVLAALALVVSACGSDDADDAAPATTVAPGHGVACHLVGG